VASRKPPRRVTAAQPGSDGNQLRNLILLALPANECDALFKNSEFLHLATHTVLVEVGEPIKFVYFINNGLASVLNIMADGKSVEVGLTGKEGFIGIPLLAGFSTSATRVIMQVEGAGYRMRASEFRNALSHCPALQTHLYRYGLQLGMQTSHLAACNRLDEVEERLARWLLMSQDRLGGDLVPLTQDFLAHMLGTRRASVTVAAGILQKAGLITYNRGHVKIDNRSRLEDAACECYAAMKQQSQRWEKEAIRLGTLAS
jgi:CRP-like cAMP-binding protein